MDMGFHFLPWSNLWLKDMCTWRMQRNRQEVRSWTDYILGTDHRLFQDVAAWDTRHYLGHYMVLGYLRGEPAKDLVGYLRKLRRFPLRPLSPLNCDLASARDKLFS